MRAPFSIKSEPPSLTRVCDAEPKFASTPPLDSVRLSAVPPGSMNSVPPFDKTALRVSAEAVKRYLPWVVATALFMEQLDSTIVNTAVPAMAASLGVEPLSLKAVVASYIVSLAVGIPISGWIADRFGTRHVFGTAVALFTVASIACGLSVSVPMLIAARILQGLGAALMTPVGRLAIIRTFAKSELLMAMNFVIIPALIGPLLGPTVGGLIVHWVSWREIFFVSTQVLMWTSTKKDAQGVRA